MSEQDFTEENTKNTSSTREEESQNDSKDSLPVTSAKLGDEPHATCTQPIKVKEQKSQYGTPSAKLRTTNLPACIDGRPGQGTPGERGGRAREAGGRE